MRKKHSRKEKGKLRDEVILTIFKCLEHLERSWKEAGRERDNGLLGGREECVGRGRRRRGFPKPEGTEHLTSTGGIQAVRAGREIFPEEGR